MMRIGYYIRNYVLKGQDGKPAISGGVKVISQHVKMLNQAGIEALLFTRKVETDIPLSELNMYDRPVILRENEDLPDCDLYVGSLFRDVKMLFQRGRGKIIHLCQGYEPIDFTARLIGGEVSEKYSRKSLMSLWQLADRWKFRKRVREIESIYALPTVKVAVSKHLVTLIEQRYQQPCFLIPNGIDPKIFFSNQDRVWGQGGKIRILSVGPIHVGFKGIPDTLQAIKILREKKVPIQFIRVSPHPPSPTEELGKVVDEYYMNLKEQEMGELYRTIDIFISSSLEGEGFGLPAMEALASGVPSVLTEISSYLNFDEKKDFGFFVPVHRPDLIAEGVIRIIENSKLREGLQERGMVVAANYTIDHTRERLLSFIKSFIP